MGILDGVKEDTFAAFAKDFRDAVLIKPSDVKVSNGQGGWTTMGSPVRTGCKALVVDYDNFTRSSTGIPTKDRKIIILAGSLPDGVIPAEKDEIEAVDPAAGNAPRTYSIVGVSGDPAGAIYRVQGH